MARVLKTFFHSFTKKPHHQNWNCSTFPCIQMYVCACDIWNDNIMNGVLVFCVVFISLPRLYNKKDAGARTKKVNSQTKHNTILVRYRLYNEISPSSLNNFAMTKRLGQRYFSIQWHCQMIECRTCATLHLCVWMYKVSCRYWN